MSIKKNFFYSSILSISNYIFPFLTFPYVSRVLGVENLGKVNFVDGIINYFLLFASLGIGTIGIREIAKNKDNEKISSSVFSNLLFFNFILTLVVCIVYIFCMYYLYKLENYQELLFIGLAKILFTLFLIEWFFAGIENFKFITVRSISIKFLYMVLVFILVNDSDDYKIYFFLTVMITVLSGILNLYYCTNFVKFSLKNISIKKYVKPVFVMGFYSLLTYMYTSYNVIYLGFISGDREVGYYTTATKIFTILLSIFTAFTTVMLPRISQLVAQNKIEDIKILIGKSYDALFMISIPTLIVGAILAPQIVEIIAGKGYEGAILPMRIVMPLILIIGIAQILIIQILMPFNNDNFILINSVIGAIVGVSLNVILVNLYSSVGSALVLLLSEMAVVISANYFVKKHIGFSIPYKKLAYHLYLSLPYAIICIICSYLFAGSLTILLSVSILSVTYFSLIQTFFIKNEIFAELERKVRSAIINKIKE